MIVKMAYAYLKEIEMIKRNLEAKEDKLHKKEYRLTSTLSFDKVMGGTYTISRVETYALDRVSLEQEIKALNKQLEKKIELLYRANMDQEEMKVLLDLATGKSLSAIARENNIYISRVYRIRDRGIKKLSNLLEKINLL